MNVRFMLNDILPDNISSASTELMNLLEDLYIKTSDYKLATDNQTDGETSDTGINLSGSQQESSIKLINSIHDDTLSMMESKLNSVYYDNVFQLLVASQTIPIGWLIKNFKNYAVVKKKIMQLNHAFNFILSSTREIKSFGLVIRTVSMHQCKDVLFYVIGEDTECANSLSGKLKDLKITNVEVIGNGEYLRRLNERNSYQTLVLFDKINSVNPNTDTYRASKPRVESLPIYTAKVGTSPNCMMVGEEIKNPNYYEYAVHKGATLAIPVTVSPGCVIYMVSINKTSYFIGSAEAEMAGISVVKHSSNPISMVTNYIVNISDLNRNVELYIGACEDVSMKYTTKKALSDKSNLRVKDNSIDMNVIFNDPFIYLDTSKVRVWAKKNDESLEEEITALDFVKYGSTFVESTANYAVPQTGIIDKVVPPSRVEFNHVGEGGCMGDNHHYFDDCFKPQTPVNKPTINVGLHYTVNVCGHLIIQISGYTNYKYFRVDFEPRAVITTMDFYNMVMLPYVESLSFINTYANIDGDDEDENDDPVNKDDESDNNTKPDGVLGQGLGFSFGND